MRFLIAWIEFSFWRRMELIFLWADRKETKRKLEDLKKLMSMTENFSSEVQDFLRKYRKTPFAYVEIADARKNLQDSRYLLMQAQNQLEHEQVQITIERERVLASK